MMAAGTEAQSPFRHIPGEPASARYLRIVDACTEAAAMARAKDDRVHLAFFLVKACEYLQLARLDERMERESTPSR